MMDDGETIRGLMCGLLVACLLGLPAVGSAQSSDGGSGDGDSSNDQQVSVEEEPSAEQSREAAERAEEKKIRQSLIRQLRTGQQQVHIYQLVEEITDEVIADVRDLKIGPITPAAIRNVGLTPNLSKQFGEFVEATLVNAVANHTDVRMKRCVACDSLRSRVEDGNWVVSMGLTKHEQLKREAERLGVKTFMDAHFSYFPQANIVAMQIEFIRARDGSVMWSETYRSDSTTAAILRSGDRVKSRKERVAELTRKISERPYFGYMVYGGMAYIPYDSPQGGISGASFGIRIYEEFGFRKRWMYGLSGEGFLNLSQTNGLIGGFAGATLQYDLLKPDLNKPQLKTGPQISGFIAGREGNSVAFEWGLDITLQFRLGAGISAMYFLPTTFLGSDLGGFGYKARFTFNW